MSTKWLRFIGLPLTAVCAAAALTACGGNGNRGAGGNPPEATATTSVTPLAAGQSYIGTLSFGDTVRVDLDAPSPGQLTVTFASSQFGLSGSLVGVYTSNTTSGGTRYAVSTFGAGPGAPAGLASAAARAGLSFTIVTDASHRGILSGALTGLPNLKANDNSTLSGQINASNNGVTAVAALAGTYSFVKLSGNYASNGVAQGDQDAESGQIHIDASGAVRFCAGQAWSESCMNYDAQTGATTATTGSVSADPDQTTYPGAFDVTANGLMLGRMFVSTSGTRTSMFLDQAGVNSDGTYRTGTWVLTTAQPLATGSSDGTWTCSEPAVADNSNTLTGSTQVTLEHFAGAQITSLNADGSTNASVAPTPLFYNETFDPKASQSRLTLTATPVDGLIAGEWTGTYQSHAVTGALVFLPLGTDQMTYLDEANANGFFVLGSCVR